MTEAELMKKYPEPEQQKMITEFFERNLDPASDTYQFELWILEGRLKEVGERLKKERLKEERLKEESE